MLTLRLSFPTSFQPPVPEYAVFHLARRLRHEAFQLRSDAALVKGHGSVFGLESLDRSPFMRFSDTFGAVPRMNDGTVSVGDGIKGDTSFHPNSRRETDCGRSCFGSATFFELL